MSEIFDQTSTFSTYNTAYTLDTNVYLALLRHSQPFAQYETQVTFMQQMSFMT